MFFIELSPGQDVRVGPCTLRVLAVHPGEVVLALLDPARDCVCCGGRPANRVCCPVCQTEALLCPDCMPTQPCPHCAFPWEAG
jgi:hypothetical protein